MKTCLIIGAGEYGAHLAVNLCEMGNEVMLVDKNERIINELSYKITATEIGDYTMRNNLEALAVYDYDYVFVCVGSFQDSLVIVDYLKELGASQIVAKAMSEIHERFLLKNGADRVVYPERDIAYNTAVEYSNKNIYEYMRLSDDAGIYEIETPDSWCGKSLVGLNVRKIHNVTVIACKNSSGKVEAIHSADYVFSKSDHIIVMGTASDIKKIAKD